MLRLGLNIPPGKAPVVSSQTVIGSGFGAQADPSVFLIGPTGLTLGKNGDLYVSDALGNRVVALPRCRDADGFRRHRQGNFESGIAEPAAGDGYGPGRAFAGGERLGWQGGRN